KMLVHVIDAAAIDGRDPIADYEKLNAELEGHDKRLIELPQLIALNKMDVPDAQTNLPRILRYFGKRKLFPISAITGEGIGGLIRATYHRLQELNEQKREDEFPFEELELSLGKPRGRF
ncbi:MAG: GTPase ObgE, partial [Candidatus Poribacteria bacterium]|nr:GTPase ObgE [Candidatus Poribacteria bacterium]